jgi:hypothetical protein
MQRDDKQLGTPETAFKDTLANIEAIGSPIAGMYAYATDEQTLYFYDGADWVPVGGTADASSVTYTPAVLTDWDGDADPGNVDNALDQLAERVDDVEGAAGHAAVTLDADAAVIFDLNAQEVGLDVQDANKVFAGPASGAANEPTFRTMDIEDLRSAGLGGIFAPFIKPVLTDFTWINQGSATATDEYGAITLYAPAQGNQNVDMHILKKAAPATPYTIEAAFYIGAMIGVNYNGFGPIWRENSSGKLANVGYFYANNFVLYVSYSSSPTVAVSNWLADLVYQRSNLLWFQISDDGTNRITRVSSDGRHFAQINSHGRTVNLTADEVGIWLNSRNVNYPLYVNWVHWKEIAS